MILVTGATGRIGRRVVERLVALHCPVRVLVRNRAKANKLLPQGIETFEGDMVEYEQVESAMDGAESVLLLSTVSPEQVQIQGNVVKAAIATSQPYIVKVSGLGTRLDSYVDSGRWHAETEQQIVESGLTYTFLRPLFFFQNLSFMLNSARSQGIIRSGVGDAKIAMVDVEDIANVAAILLMKRDLLLNQAVTEGTAGDPSRLPAVSRFPFVRFVRFVVKISIINPVFFRTFRVFRGQKRIRSIFQ